MEETKKILISNNPTGVYQTLKSKNKLVLILESTKFLDKEFDNIRWSQRFWHIRNNIFQNVICSVCGSKFAKYNLHKQIYITCGDKICISKKMENTNIKRYGVKSYSLTSESKEKSESTCIEKYGVNHQSKSESIKKKIRNTHIKRYGVDNYSKTKEFKSKSRNTFYHKHGVDNYSKTKEFKNKLREIFTNKFMLELPDDYNLKEFGEELTIEHSICGNKFKILSDTCYARLKKYEVEICTVCNPINKEWSAAEKELLYFVESIYDGKIVENTRKIISPFELDIYLPDLNLAFEYNGDYWHSLKSDGYHEMKSDLCKELGINLIHVWEKDWLSEKDVTKNKIIRLF